jgi:hypothetical protein
MSEVIYNVTVKVSNSIAVNWLKWLQQEHVPEVIATGCFTSARIVQLLEVDNDEGPTYAIQYLAPDKQHYEKYISQFASQMREKSFEKWGDQFVAFRSVMEVVSCE